MNGVIKDVRGSCVVLEVEDISPGPKHFQRIRDEEVMWVGWKERNKEAGRGEGKKGRGKMEREEEDKRQMPLEIMGSQGR